MNEKKKRNKYLIRKIRNLAIMMAFIYLIQVILGIQINYEMAAIVYLGIIITAPILSWIMSK